MKRPIDRVWTLREPQTVCSNPESYSSSVGGVRGGRGHWKSEDKVWSGGMWRWSFHVHLGVGTARVDPRCHIGPGGGGVSNSMSVTLNRLCCFSEPQCSHFEMEWS